MKGLTQFAKLLQWPAVYVMLALALNDKWCTIAFTLALAYRNDLSAMLRRRRLLVRGPGFWCRIDGGTDSPEGIARNPPHCEQ